LPFDIAIYLTTIPVVDDNMKLLGRVTVDDIIDVMEEENTEDILKISVYQKTRN